MDSFLILRLQSEADKGNYITTGPIEIYYKQLNPAKFIIHQINKYLDDKSSWEKIKSSGEYSNTIEFVNNLLENENENENEKVIRKITKSLEYKNIQYWQFMPSYVWPNLYAATQLVELMVALPSSDRITKIYAHRSSATEIDFIWQKILIEWSKSNEIELIFIKDKINFRRLINCFIKLYRYFRFKSCEFLAFTLITVMKIKLIADILRSHDPNKGKTIFVTLASRHWKEGSEENFKDEQFSPIYKEMSKRRPRELISVDVQQSIKALFSICIGKRNIDGEYPMMSTHLQAYYPLLNFLNWKIKRHFRSEYHHLIQDKFFRSKFTYLGISIFGALKNTLDDVFFKLAPKCYKYVDCAKKIIVKESPDSIIITYETGPWGRAFIIAARELNVPTVGLQHGNLFKNNYDYMHKKISHPINHLQEGFSIPDMICVWGKQSKYTLTNFGTYPSDALSITGNWRYDNFKNQIDLSKDSTEIDHLKKNITIGIFLNGIQSGFVLQECINILGGYQNINFLVRKHPADNEGEILNIITKNGLEKDIYHVGLLSDLIIKCDIIFSGFSTVISEGALFSKPILMIDYQKEHHQSMYVTSGICLYATDSDEITECLELMLFDKEIIRDLKKCGEVFIEEFFHKVDGKCSARVVDVVEHLENQANKNL